MMPTGLRPAGLAMLVLFLATLSSAPCLSLPALAQETTNQFSKSRADQLLQQGIEQYQINQFEAAFKSFQQALVIYQQTKDRLAEGNALSKVGDAYSELENYVKAIDYQQQSLEIAWELKDRRLEGQALNNLGNAYFFLNNYPKAFEHLQQSLIIARELKYLLGQGELLNSLGLTYLKLGNYAKAVEHLQQSLEIAWELKNRRLEGVALGNLGLAYLDLGNYAKATNYHQQSLAIAREIKNRTGEGESLNNLGLTYFELGDYAKAIDYYQHSLTILRELKNRRLEGQVLGNLGLVYSDLGNYAKAIDYYQQSLTISRERKDGVGGGNALGNLGNAYSNLGDYPKAINYHKQYLAVAWEHKDQLGEGNALGNLGNAYSNLGDYPKAIDYYNQQLGIVRKIKDRLGERKALGNMGIAYFFLKDYPKAISYYQQSIAIAREIKNRAGEALFLSNMGNLFATQEQFELAIVFYKQSINVRESIRQEARKLSREEQQSYTQSISHTYRNLANLLLQQRRVMEALQVLDLLKVQELQDFFKDVKGNKRTAQGIEMLSEEQQLIQHLKTTPFLDLNEYLKSSSITSLIQQLRQTAEAQNLKLVVYTDLQARLQNLRANSALLYPLILDDRIELVVFTRNAPPVRRTTNIKQIELEQSVQSFWAAIQQKDSQDVRQPAKQLYNWLIKPIEADLQQANIKTIIYAPDGQMRYVPLAALYDGKQWLVEKYQINYITALSLTNIETRSSQQPHILAGAFTDSAGSVRVNGQAFDFGAIPSALSEVESLAKQFPNTTKLIYKDFNRAGMTFDRLNRYNIVHLATHGKLVSGAPEDSFILLNNNEYITLKEIKDWKLPNVALVVLSACQTALGDKLGSGIEVIGFGYQLQQAQARASIATLWEISDASTGSLMNEFYAELQSKQLRPVEALHEAQIALITGKGKTSGTAEPRSSVNYSSGQRRATISRNLSHPYYWAPFILIGNGL